MTYEELADLAKDTALDAAYWKREWRRAAKLLVQAQQGKPVDEAEVNEVVRDLGGSTT